MSREQFVYSQAGSFLLEALIGIVIFALGALAMVALQANAITVQSDAEYRIEAASFADQILGQINANVQRDTNNAVITSTLNAFSHNATTSASCNFTGSPNPPTNPIIANWVSAITTGATGLPGSTTAMQQIVIDTGNNNQTTVVICWRSPRDQALRYYRVIGYVN
jgi:type IV pilus assembly protein PilV